MDDIVVVEHIEYNELGQGKITEISYETGESLISVSWPNGDKGQYWAEELEFIIINQ